MTEAQMRRLQIGDICKDVEVSSNYGRDVFCKVIDIQEDRLEVDCIEGMYCEAYPQTMFYRTCSWKLEK